MNISIFFIILSLAIIAYEMSKEAFKRDMSTVYILVFILIMNVIMLGFDLKGS